MQLGGKALALSKGVSAGGGADGMCDPCRAKSATLKDLERRCAIPGCTGTTSWTAAAQLEAFATRRPPPQSLCASCEGKLAALQDQEIACATPGCARTATLTKRAQLLATSGVTADAPAAPEAAEAETEPPTDNGKRRRAEEPRGRVTFTGTLCTPCADVATRISDRSVLCGISGCKRKWVWLADDQLQAFAADKPNEPPRRMCAECRGAFGKLLDRPVRCRTSGCKKTWTWPRGDQLDACYADKPPPKAPHLMCEDCYKIFEPLRDVDRPCRKTGCKKTWNDRRGAQLARAVRGRGTDPYPQYCEEHKRELGDLEDREITCKTDGCPGTWTWAKAQQLAAGVRPEPLPEAPAPAAAPSVVVLGATPDVPAPLALDTDPAAAPPALASKKEKRPRKPRVVQPPERLCAACVEFLHGKKTMEIPCAQCATPIYWPPESQLQTHLGHWAVPSMCGACRRDLTEATRKAEREELVRKARQSAPGAAQAAQAAQAVPSTTDEPGPAQSE